MIGSIIAEFNKCIQNANTIISDNLSLLTDEINSYINIMHDDYDKTIRSYEIELNYYKQQKKLANKQRNSFLKALGEGRIPAKDPNQAPSNTSIVQKKLHNDKFDITFIQICEQADKTKSSIIELKNRLSKETTTLHVGSIIFDTDIPTIPPEVRFLRRNSLGSLREYISQEELLSIPSDESTPKINRSYSLSG